MVFKGAGRIIAVIYGVALLIFGSSLVLAAVDGALPVSASIFYNGWPEGDAKWGQIVAAYNAGDLDKVESLLQPLTKGPQAELALANLAVVQKDRGNYNEAVKAYRAAVNLAPDDSGLRGDLGWVLYYLARYNEAEAEFRLALSKDQQNAWLMYGLGMALAKQTPSKGLTYLEQAVNLNPKIGPAYYDLGFVYYGLGDTDKAAAAWEAALAIDGNFTTAHAYLARIYEQRGDLDRAWRSYQRGALARPNDAELKASKERFRSENQEYLRQAEQEALVARESVVIRDFAAHNVPDSPLVRVGLLENVQLIRLAWSAPMEVRRAGKTVALLNPEGIWTLTKKGDVLSIVSPDGTLVVSGEAPWELVPTRSTSATVVYDMVVGQGTFYARVEHRQFRGFMEARSTNKGLTLINIVDLETYLASVVPSEMWASMPLEALKAQAIAARTYTLRSIAAGRYRSRGFDVLGTPLSSAYRGAGAENARTTQAVMETAGMVLVTPKGNLAETFYSSSAGGFSVSAQEAWGGNISYLVAKIDSDSVKAPTFPLGPKALEAWIKNIPLVFSSQSRYTTQTTFRWVKFVDASELESTINARQKVGRLLHVETKQRSKGGHVQTVEVIGTSGVYTVKGDAIRSVFSGLRSNLFKVEVVRDADGWPERFIFFGGGFGHGVGLDQLGASGMAEQGYGMLDILRHYYDTAEVRIEY